jgi:cytochrome c peroxidase
VLAAQAMFPVTSRDEMRGAEGENELAEIPDDDLQGIWSAIMDRLLAIPEYFELFQDAYPNVAPEDFGFEHAANAIGAFESVQFTFLDSPFDAYLEGSKGALSDPAKRGALLFYGKAGCSKCHSGSLFTDQQHHNIGIPPLGPGKAPEKPLDFGRARETGEQKDIYAFRTPPLRNVALTGPWMHNGAFTTLRSAIEHHLDVKRSLRHYDVSQLDVRLQDSVIDAPEVIEDILGTLDKKIKRKTKLKQEELDDLEAFLFSLTSNAVLSGALLSEETFPLEVPSGLPVDGAEAFSP